MPSGVAEEQAGSLQWKPPRGAAAQRSEAGAGAAAAGPKTRVTRTASNAPASELQWRPKRAAHAVSRGSESSPSGADGQPGTASNRRRAQAVALAQGTQRVSPVRWRSPVVQTQGLDPEPALLPPYEDSPDEDESGDVASSEGPSAKFGGEARSLGQRGPTATLARRAPVGGEPASQADMPDDYGTMPSGLRPQGLAEDEDAAEVLNLKCADEYAKLKQLKELSTNISPPGGVLPPECPLVEEPGAAHGVVLTTFTWTASALCHKPLYLEDVALERYGHSWGPILQPFVSGTRFYLGTLAIPYKMGIEPPTECVYALGYYRPGSCAPYTLGPIPISARGALLQGIYATGAALSIP